MYKIIKSVFAIVAVVALSVGATGAYFSDTATITDNTFTTGTLDIRINGVDTLVGQTYGPAAPGQVFTSDVYRVRNFGNLTAKTVLLSATETGVPSGLYSALSLKIEVPWGPSWISIYEGNLSDLNGDSLLASWEQLAPGAVKMFRYSVWLPETGLDQSGLMGQTATWSFSVEGRTN